jgi:hypothetical protein
MTQDKETASIASRYEDGLERVYNRLGFKEQVCPICSVNSREGIMEFRYSIVQQEPICDSILLKCKTCKHIVVFGLPMTSAEFEHEVEERNGTWFTPHWKDGSDPDSIVVDRLVKLGYIEYEYRRSKGVT